MNHFPIKRQKGASVSGILGLVTLLIIIIAVGSYYFPKPAQPTTPDIIIDTDLTQPVTFNTYFGSDISFEYPSLLTLSEEAGTITLIHALPYNHPDPCDFKGDAPALEKITDFHTSLKVVNQSIEKYVKSNTWPDWNYVSQNPYSLNTFSGYHVTSGVEGCGQEIYYLALSPNKTVIITKKLVNELSDISSNKDMYLQIPGIIFTAKADEYFQGILNSLKVD